MKDSPTLHIALPAMNEREFIAATLQCLAEQTYQSQEVWICINQPDAWWQDAEKKAICENNSQTLSWLSTCNLPKLRIIDKSSPGMGWTGKAHGVGQARKTLMDAIAQQATAGDIIVSLDADTRFGPGYLESIVSIFHNNARVLALSNPYFHELTGNEVLDRAMLRYEIYMRHYSLNMFRIGSPYSFTALGSAISFPVETYRKVGGMTAKKSGEDFYLLQKIRKAGIIAQHNTELVYPATRYSDRVFFGTGPALIKGSQGNWSSYPIYDYTLFDRVRATYNLFDTLFHREEETPMTAFLQTQFADADIFGPLRKNFKSAQKFIEACHHKVDGLRVLQYLKYHQSLTDYSDENNLLQFMHVFYPDFFNIFDKSSLQSFSFQNSSIEQLNRIRIFLMEKEKLFQITQQK